MNRHIYFITLQEPYATRVASGKKTVEFRNKVPADLQVGDLLAIVRAGSHGEIIGIYEVFNVAYGAVEVMWQAFKEHAGIELADLSRYARRNGRVFAIEFRQCRYSEAKHYIAEYGFKTSPQWFYKLGWADAYNLRRDYCME